MALKLGIDCKLYRNTGTYGSPTWNEVTTVRDLTLNLTHSEANAGSRGSTWDFVVAAMKQADLTFNLLGDDAIDDHDALRDAFMNKTVVDLAIANGSIATTGNKYFRCDFQVFSFNKNEPLRDSVDVSITLKPTYSANVPAWTTVP